MASIVDLKVSIYDQINDALDSGKIHDPSFIASLKESISKDVYSIIDIHKSFKDDEDTEKEKVGPKVVKEKIVKEKKVAEPKVVKEKKEKVVKEKKVAEPKVLNIEELGDMKISE